MRVSAALPVLFISAAGHAFGWGCEGHAIVALIARAHLTAATSAAVDRLLKENPIDPALKRFCEGRPADPMADAATWPDDVRSAERTGNWHFVDIPNTVETGTKLDEWCPPVGPSLNGKDRPGCVTNALEAQWAILRDLKASAAERAVALRYIIHFVGDMHQPLHVSDNDDRGGNCTAMTFFDDGKPANLHSIWDYRILQRTLADKHATVPAYAAALDRQFGANWPAWGDSGIKPQDWAWEGHAIALQTTYGNLKPAIPLVRVALGNCDAERDSVTALHIAVGPDYYAGAAPVIDRQLAKAGYRLAEILNSSF